MPRTAAPRYQRVLRFRTTNAAAEAIEAIAAAEDRPTGVVVRRLVDSALRHAQSAPVGGDDAAAEPTERESKW